MATWGGIWSDFEWGAPSFSGAGPIIVGNEAVPANTFSFYEKIPVTISAGQSLSAPICIGDASIVALEIPSPTSWQTANLTFQAATDRGAMGGTPGTIDPTLATYNNLFDRSGSEYTVTVGALTAGRFITLVGGTSGAGFITIDGIRYIKIRSGTASVPVTQTSAQTINLIVKIS